MSGATPPASRLQPVAFMVGAVALQIGAAALLKTLADSRSRLTLLALLGGIAAVMALNAARFAVWGLAHRRFPLSTVYPLSALFFPALLLLAFAFGDPIRAREVAGAAFVTAGSAWLAWRAPQ